jgi:ABC-type polysaccharide/polyol phosphate transport system ATPase subunit
MQASNVISVEDVTQRFRVFQERPDSIRALFSKFFRYETQVHDFDAVKNITFHVRQGEMVGIVGRNGSGKSTLLKIVAGVYKPTTGAVTVNGRVAPMIELGAGFHMELTGRENILINGLLLGYSKAEMAAKEQSIIDFAEIGDFIDAPVKQYSSGMFARLAFGVAIEVDPDILLIDEILAVGDMGFQEKCFERLKRFREARKTILFVTHSPKDVIDYCDRALLIDEGHLVIDGKPDEVIDMYRNVVHAHEHPQEMLAPVGVG